MRLNNLLNEKLEISKPDISLSASNENDLKIIDSLVKSKKKDDRISVGANPNLTQEQFELLSTDKVNAVKESLCFNPNIPLEIANKLFAEDSDRITILAVYSDSHLDDFLLKNMPLKAWRGTIESVTKKRKTISLNFLTKLVDIIGAEIFTTTSVRPLFRRKDLDDKTIKYIFDLLYKQTSNSDYPLTKLILNQEKYFKESDLKKLDWKSNFQIQNAILYRDDISESFLIDVVNSLVPDTRLSYLSDNPENKNSKNPKVLNALLKYLLSQDSISYFTSFAPFEKAKKIPLDAKLLVNLVQKMITTSRDNDLSSIISNVSFPDEGLDLIPIRDSKVLKYILQSPNITDDRVSVLLNKYVTDKNMLEDLFWGLADCNNEISVKDQEKMLNNYNVKSYIFSYICRGEFADIVLKDIKKYAKYLTMPADDDFYLIVGLAKNKKLSSKQKKEVFKHYLKMSHTNEKYDRMFYENIITMNNNTPEFLEELINVNKDNIWYIWTASGSSYFQYSGKLKDKIDKIVLSTPNVPKNVISGLSNKTFDDWFKYNNNTWNGNSNQMSKEMCFKYLIHFIKTGSQEALTLLTTDNFLNDEYITPEVKNELYIRTSDEKYIPDSAKDIFLF